MAEFCLEDIKQLQRTNCLEETEALCEKIFAVADANGNGAIDAEEFLKIVRTYAAADSDESNTAKQQEEFAQKAMKALDTNADGQVTLEEFKKFFWLQFY